MPGYKVKLGFGLHQGWAIEGTIGSYFKIDATYLSPNVNMASRLEATTKQYDVPILISGEFFDVLSLDVK
jgi:class 3 adenylate cyclase